MDVRYVHREEIHNFQGPKEVVPLIMQMIKPVSVLDVGCGTGTWLKTFEEQGVSDYVGVDGDYVDRSLLKIPVEKFESLNLQTSFAFRRKFDLVLCLEVAEHLDEIYADQFIESLCQHGDTIIFSAAIPGQGGQNHLNEQWPEYWEERFSSHGYYFHDVIRPMIWSNPKVEWWYRQNIFLVNKCRPLPVAHQMLSAIHPDFYLYKVNLLRLSYNKAIEGNLGLKASADILFRALMKTAKDKMNF